jgi:membrane-associated protease RseP (regulator of RpoE activity)
MSVIIDKFNSVGELANDGSLPPGTVPVVAAAGVISQSILPLVGLTVVGSFCALDGKTVSKKEIVGTNIVFDSGDVEEFKGFDFTAEEGQAMARHGIYAEPMQE